MNNKLFSIFGDSISTLEGCNPEGYNVFYTGENAKNANVLKEEDTWWYKVINHFGGKLLVNNSWSGSSVTKLKKQEELFPSGCSDQRINNIGKGSETPDIIIIYLGINDWGFGVDTGINISDSDYTTRFDLAYAKMKKK